MVRGVNDIIRMALRDLRGSDYLLRLAQGTGTLEDLESLTKWADELYDRANKTQKVVAQPKPTIVSGAPVSEPQEPVLVPVAVSKSKAKAKKKRDTTPEKRDTTPKQPPHPTDVAFAIAVAEELGDNKVKDWANQYANGKISEKQWISRLTSHAASKRDSLDTIFARAAERLEKQANAKEG